MTMLFPPVKVRSWLIYLALFVLFFGLSQTDTTAARLTFSTPGKALTRHTLANPACAGEPQVFTVPAHHQADVTYQWLVSTDKGATWNAIAGDTSFAGVDTPVLTVTPPFSFNGYWFRCRIGDGPSATYSTTEILAISLPTQVTLQPAAAYVMEQDMTVFFVEAAGLNLTYQWEVNPGTGWMPVSDGKRYQGSTNAALLVTEASWFMHRYQYRCVVSGQCGPPVTSGAATLRIRDIAYFVSQPAPATICAGKHLDFSVSVVEAAGYRYQWQESRDGGSQWTDIREDSVYANATGATLAVKAALALDHYLYRCRMTGETNTFTSEPVKLTVLEQPALTSQAGSMTTCAGSNAAFAIAASGTDLTYQWQVNTGDGTWVNIADNEVYRGVQSDNLALTGVPEAWNGYQYRCLVAGTCPGTYPSAPVALTVLRPGTWKGLSADWQEDRNWCGGVPTATTDITIPAGAAHMPLAAAATCRDLTIARGATLTLAGALAIQGTPTLLGRLVVGAHALSLNGGPIQGDAANLVATPVSDLVLGGSTAGIAVPASVTALNRLVVNNSSSTGIQLSGDLVLNSLELSQGKLLLQAGNLRMLTAGAITGGDASRYIVIPGDPAAGGALIQPVKNDDVYVTFPVGTADSFSPVQVKLTPGSAADEFSVRVFDQLLAEGTTGKLLAANVVNKTWMVAEARAGGSVASLRLGWLDQQELQGFHKSRIKMAHLQNQKWSFPSILASSEKDNAGVNWSEQHGYTGFSLFSVMDETAAGSLVAPVVKVKVFLQGPYAANNKMGANIIQVLPLRHPYGTAPFTYAGTEQVAPGFFPGHGTLVDWVLLELRSAVNAGSAVATRACLLKEDGQLVEADGSSAPAFPGLAAGNYYLVIKHRNHLSVMSSQPVALHTHSLLYDFTTGLSQYYGGEAALLAPGLYGMFGGDANGSDFVTYADQPLVNPALIFQGYYPGDLDLSAVMNTADRSLIMKNINKKSKVPQ